MTDNVSAMIAAETEEGLERAGIVQHPDAALHARAERQTRELLGAHRRAPARHARGRARWAEHITQTHMHPVLIIDESQEALTPMLSELRILASKDFDARQLLCVVLAGDSRLPERLRSAELLPLGSRVPPSSYSALPQIS